MDVPYLKKIANLHDRPDIDSSVHGSGADNVAVADRYRTASIGATRIGGSVASTKYSPDKHGRGNGSKSILLVDQFLDRLSIFVRRVEVSSDLQRAFDIARVLKEQRPWKDLLST